jgi:hypothetical protein
MLLSALHVACGSNTAIPDGGASGASSGSAAGSGTPVAESGSAGAGAPEASTGTSSGAAASGMMPVPVHDAGPDAGPGSMPADEAGVTTVDDGGGSGSGAGPGMICPMLTTGWMEYHPPVKLQFEDGEGTWITPMGPPNDQHSTYCTYTNMNGIELFKMLKDPAGKVQRCEMRVQNEYTSGSNQFEGDVRVTAGNATCVHQVFLMLMLDAFPNNGGEFREHTGTVVTNGVFNKWVHVNTIHHVGTAPQIYIDCVMKGTAAQQPYTGTGWYNKYGVYSVNHAPPVEMLAQSEWKNVHIYRK